jgi:hypothetical protein
MEVNRFHLYTSSSKKQSGTNEDYNITLRRPLILSNPHHYWKCIVKQSTIPYTFQQVSDNYNQFSYVLTRGGTTYPQKTFSISNGNYNINSLITEVTTKLVANIQTYVPTYTPTFNWTYDRDNMFVMFAFTPDATNTSFTIKPLTNQISTMLGVVTDTVFSNVGSIMYSGSSTQPVDVNPITSIYIRSDTLKQNYLSSENLVGSDDVSDILCQIPLMGQPTSWIQYLNDLQIENRLSNETVNEINLYLSDNRSYSLNLRGIPWSCMITFIEMAPPIEDYIQQIRKDIRNGNRAVNDVMDSDIKFQEFKKGAPLVETIGSEPTTVIKPVPEPVSQKPKVIPVERYRE